MYMYIYMALVYVCQEVAVVVIWAWPACHSSGKMSLGVEILGKLNKH